MANAIRWPEEPFNPGGENSDADMHASQSLFLGANLRLKLLQHYNIVRTICTFPDISVQSFRDALSSSHCHTCKQFVFPGLRAGGGT